MRIVIMTDFKEQYLFNFYDCGTGDQYLHNYYILYKIYKIQTPPTHQDTFSLNLDQMEATYNFKYVQIEAQGAISKIFKEVCKIWEKMCLRTISDPKASFLNNLATVIAPTSFKTHL